MNAEKILTQMLAGGAGSGFAGALAGSLAGGLLTSKAGRKLGGKALELGGLAAIAGLAYTAWKRYREGAPIHRSAGAALEAPPPAFLPPADRRAETQQLANTLLLAMIAAARADGQLDGEERLAIFARATELELSEAERAEFYAALEQPVELEWLLRQATTPERAAEIYAASLVAVGSQSPAERGYLSLLEARLDLPPDLAASLRGEVASAGTAG